MHVAAPAALWLSAWMEYLAGPGSARACQRPTPGFQVFPHACTATKLTCHVPGGPACHPLQWHPMSWHRAGARAHTSHVPVLRHCYNPHAGSMTEGADTHACMAAGLIPTASVVVRKLKGNIPRIPGDADPPDWQLILRDRDDSRRRRTHVSLASLPFDLVGYIACLPPSLLAPWAVCTRGAGLQLLPVPAAAAGGLAACPHSIWSQAWSPVAPNGN